MSGAHKAWLALSPNAARSFIGLPGFDEESSVTGIQRQADHGNDDWYNLEGRKLQGCPTKKGVYLHNGRKVIVN